MKRLSIYTAAYYVSFAA